MIEETPVLLGFSADTTERASKKLVDALNEEARKQAKDLGHQFVFSFSDKAKDVVYHHSIVRHAFDKEAYSPLSASIKTKMAETDYVKPVRDYLSSYLEEENLVPVSFSFESMSYDPEIYSPEDLNDYGGLLEKMADTGGHLIHDNLLFVSYLLGTRTLSIEECGKMDGGGIPVWSNPSLEPFYKELNARLNPPSAKTVRIEDAVANTSIEGKAIRFLPELTLSTEVVKPISIGYLSSVTFAKESQLGDEEKSALENFFYVIGVKGNPYYEGSAPMLGKDYESDEIFANIKSEIEDRVYMDLFHMGQPYYAVFDLAYQLGNSVQPEDFSFVDYYSKMLSARLAGR